MNIHLIIKAVEALDEAILMTLEVKERTDLECVNRRLRKILQRRGIFIGQPKKEKL